MGLFLTASFALLNSNALYPSEERGALARLVHYEQRIEGWVFSQQVKVGMTEAEVCKIVRGARSSRGVSTTQVLDWYVRQGLIVFYDEPECEFETMHVTRLSWRWQWYSNR